MSALDAYPHRRVLGTRWADNDIYGHVNNVEYYALFDTLINAYLIKEGGLDIHAGDVIGVCAASQCDYHAAIAFPEDVTGGLRVAKLGRSSVTYEIGLATDSGLAATGSFTHVFVDRATRRPAPIEGRLRDALQRLVRD
ncbi:acyl-CoA thioesterase [Solirubrobacter ginsenosidimutans]|uniref:Acyl-CoA thioesterase n=1 Tax=Solirubrobacter ginsenosidimutans TaxID=490573 RepID=A0A9X3MZ82_9ACTN|nr:thioesterase family protein [Solirubrobacter ginsenosidimutans]MDA0164073.1 acyl-CoA thioesterase [Solirubrobacter ginsenosidimutans]